MIVLDGTSLTCADVAAIGRRAVGVEITASGRGRASLAAQVSRDVAAGLDIYGRSSGVGANRGFRVDAADAQAHGLRLLRSHAGDAGPLLEPELGVALLAVRANQIAAGGSGVDPGVLDVLADCVNRGLRPPARVYGAIGTGDLTALAVTALCLLGERDWLPDPANGADRARGEPLAGQPRFALQPTDALAFLSSNAATIAEAAIACHDLHVLLAAGEVIAAFSHLAAGASAEPYAEAVQLARPHPGQQHVAASLRGLLAGEPIRTSRNQHPYGFRALPQVHGAAVDAVEAARHVVTCELNSAAENPLVDAAGLRFWHNGNFHTAYLALALDAARAAVFQAAALCAARLGALMDPSITGLAGFLAADPVPSSGLMITEYVAQSALADIRLLAAPAALGSAVVSLGAEEHAGFGTQAARATTGVVRAYRVALACELVAAVRGLRQLGIRPVSSALASALDLAAAALPDSMADRALDGDFAAAQELLPELAPQPPTEGAPWGT
jgi:histidine ammonia-lyase